jgi:hypothetical protein
LFLKLVKKESETPTMESRVDSAVASALPEELVLGLDKSEI